MIIFSECESIEHKQQK